MKKLLFALMITILSVSIVGCGFVSGDPDQESTSESKKESVKESVSISVSEPDSDVESESSPIYVPDSDPESDIESQPESDPESQPESQPDSEPDSEPESQPDSEPEEEIYTVTLIYQTVYGGATQTKTFTGKEGESIEIQLPTINYDQNATYGFDGWKIRGTSTKYDRTTTVITVVLTGDVTIESVFVKQFSDNY